MEDYKKEFIEFMIDCEVLKFGDFVTKSGRKTPFFVNTGFYRTGAQLRRLGQYYARAIKDTLRNNTVVTTIMSNFGLYKAFDREGISYEKTAVGDKYVYENMSQYGNCLGGEQSGHIIFSKHATTGDGILTSLKVMEVMLEKKETLGKLASEVEILPQVLKNVRVKDKKEAQDDPAVQAEVAKVTETLGADGRILLRQSGTEPVVRVMVEAPTTEQCEMLVDQVIEVMKAQGHVL